MGLNLVILEKHPFKFVAEALQKAIVKPVSKSARVIANFEPAAVMRFKRKNKASALKAENGENWPFIGATSP
jgi:hypothetical protein